MSWTKGLIKEALNWELTPEIDQLSDALDNKVENRNFWISDIGKRLAKKLQDDAQASLNSLLNFETMTPDEIRGLLAKYRSNMLVLSSIRESDNIEEVQSLLDNAVKSRAEEMRGR